MRIAILSRTETLYSTQRIKEAAQKRGHEVKVLDFLNCYMDISANEQSIYYQGQKLGQFDAIIPRVGTNRTFYGAAVIRQFETMGVYTINPSIAVTRSRDKLRSLQLLARQNIGMPRTSFASNPAEIDSLIASVGGPPVVIKLLEGTQGVGVVLAETKKAAESVIQAFMSLSANIILQEFIEEAGGSDIRCFVVGDEVVGAMKRTAPEGEFRSNVHRGGSVEVVELNDNEKETAIKAVKAMGLGLGGVDLLRSSRGPLIMEVNSSPGLEGIEKATQKDIAGCIIEYIERVAGEPIDDKHEDGRHDRRK